MRTDRALEKLRGRWRATHHIDGRASRVGLSQPLVAAPAAGRDPALQSLAAVNVTTGLFAAFISFMNLKTRHRCRAQRAGCLFHRK